MDQHMLTTTDNPFSPVTQYDEWLTWDLAHGYCSNALLARVAFTSPELSDDEQIREIEFAINAIVEANLSGVHTKVLMPSDTMQAAA